MSCPIAKIVERSARHPPLLRDRLGVEKGHILPRLTSPLGQVPLQVCALFPAGVPVVVATRTAGTPWVSRGLVAATVELRVLSRRVTVLVMPLAAVKRQRDIATRAPIRRFVSGRMLSPTHSGLS